MNEMEGSMRSGGVIKKKSSSGCLIIKKKADVLGSGVVGSSSNKEKKRPRGVIASQYGSSDESLLEPVRRKFDDRMQNGGGSVVVYGRRGMEEGREFRRNGETNVETDRKRGRMKLFEFDEYDEFDGEKMRNDFMGMVGGNSREYAGSGRNVMEEKRKHHCGYFDGSGSGLSGRSKTIGVGGKNRHDLEDDEANLPISMLRLKYQEESAESIRLQGRNGVLKVMVNKKKKKKMDMSSSKGYDRQVVDNIRKESSSEEAVKEETPLRPAFHSDTKRAEKPIAFMEKEKSRMKLKKQVLGKPNKAGESEREKGEQKLQKQLMGKRNRGGDHESDVPDTSLKLAPSSLDADGAAAKAVKREAKRSLPSENDSPIEGRERTVTAQADNLTPTKGKDAKLKRGGSTEKQLLRERIREMLINAGWTIDYRPRRNRDYLDAVYINPSGTAYWSIIKAYDALQKQWPGDDNKSRADGESSSFTPLSGDLINKLTRQTRKKMEAEMKRKRKECAVTKKPKKGLVKDSAEDSDSDHHEEKLSSFVRQNGKSKKGRFHETNCEDGEDLSDDSCGEEPEQEGNAARRSKSKSNVVQARKSKTIGRCTLLVRYSENGPNSESDGYVPYTGKRTLLAWLIDSGTVKSSEKVQYMNRRRTRVKLEGWITRDGIHCGCCSKILMVSKFELHAGSKLRQPFQNIILESGPSLLQCLVDAWNKQEESVRQDFHIVDVDSDDPDDDTCGICGDGGDFICCDGCPSTFHQICLGIKILPPGDWHCPHCTCKFCGTTAENVTKEGDGTANELITCSLCEKKYHQSCSKGMVAPPVLSNNASASFCGKVCQELYDHLQKITGIKHELEAGFSWSLVQRTDLESDTAHRGFPQRVECNSKLAVALTVMDECFLPIVDRRSEINLIRNVLYNCGSNFSRLNFRGFYAMILERGDEIISAASIRIHGTQLAEMPFIGTRHIYRRQGMCRRLLSAIESVLCSLKVEKLIIPAISEHMHTWTVVFGFKPLQDSDKKEMKSMNMLVFPGTDMLQKKLMKQEIPEGTEIVESKGDDSPLSPALVIKSEIDSLEKQENVQEDAGSEHKGDIIDKAYVLSASAVSSVDVTVTRGLYGTQESDVKSSSMENKGIEPQLKQELAESAGRLECSSPSVTATDFQTRNTDASQDLAEDQSPTLLSSPCAIVENSEKKPEEDKPTVVETRKQYHTLDGSLPEAILGGALIEPRTSPSPDSPVQNATEKTSTPDSTSAPAPVTNEDPVSRSNSDLNQPLADYVESEGDTLSGAVSDAKAANFDSGTYDQNMGEVKDNPSVVASESDFGAEVHDDGEDTCELNAEAVSVEPILDSSPKKTESPKAEDTEKIQDSLPSATSGGTNESSICSSPDLNRQAPIKVEAESRDTPETLPSDDAAQAKPSSQTDGASKSDDSQNLNAGGDHVELALSSFPASSDHSREEQTMA